MQEKLMKMMSKKKGSGLSDVEKEAKMGVLSDMKKMAEDAMSGKIKGLKKVTVASDSPMGLKEGLEKAKDIVAHKADDSEESDESDMEDESSPEDTQEDYSEAEQAIDGCDDMEELNKLEEMIKAKKMEMMKS